MIPTRILESSLEEMNAQSVFALAACGYEHRASALLPKISDTVKHRCVLAFKEHHDAFHRRRNDKKFEERGFISISTTGNSSVEVGEAVKKGLDLQKESGGALVFDISSMTRAWQGAIIQVLMTQTVEQELETYFVYVPRRFDKPPEQDCANEIVGPVQGFAALAPPDLPIALLLSLGYERTKALGLMEILDPGQTVLLVAKSSENDPFYPNVIKNNREILRRVNDRWVFPYPLAHPATTFRILESICTGLGLSYRVVLAPMGPKLFALLCFLMAARHSAMSVWRMSTGLHAEPKDAVGDVSRAITVKVVWSPDISAQEWSHTSIREEEKRDLKPRLASLL